MPSAPLCEKCGLGERTDRAAPRRRRHSAASRRSLRAAISPDFATLEEVVEAADAVPAIATRFEQDAMSAAVVGMTMVFAK
jgi:hypothetical protein